MTLYQRTLQLIQNKPTDLTMSDIAKATGLKFDWLCSFSQGKISDPSVNKVQTLYEYLAKNTLKV